MRTSLQDACLLITDGKHGDCQNEEDSGYFFISCKDVRNGRIDYSSARQITQGDFLDTHKRTQLEPNDILITNSGTIGRMALVPNTPETSRTTFQKSVAIVKPKQERVVAKWLYYYLAGKRDELVAWAGGTAQKNLLLRDLRAFAIQIPSFPVQRRIASILSAYDDLIENNLRRIKILEEMAQALYREWFVKFRFPGHEKVRMVESSLGEIPEGWEIMRAPDAIDFRPRTTAPKGGLKPFVPMSSLADGSLLISNVETREGNSGSKFRNCDTLFARITPCLENGKTGFVQFLPTPESVALGSTEFIVLRSKSLCPELVYLMARSNEFRDNAIKSMTGASGRQRVQDGCFDKFIFAHPDKETIATFSDLVNPMFRRIQSLADANTNLRKTRDLLLPKLISGDLDVSNLDIPIPEDAA